MKTGGNRKREGVSSEYYRSCMYLYMNVCRCIGMFTCVFTCMGLSVCVQLYMDNYYYGMYVYMYVCMYAFISMHAYIMHTFTISTVPQ